MLAPSLRLQSMTMIPDANTNFGKLPTEGGYNKPADSDHRSVELRERILAAQTDAKIF
jgi:hypothetical protein